MNVKLLSNSSRPVAMLLMVLFSVASLVSVSASELFKASPKPTAQFDFLIGDWDCYWFGYNPRGEKGKPIKCSWNARYNFEQQIVQDDFLMADDKGNIMFNGTTLRTYSPSNNRWEFAFLATRMPGNWQPWHGTWDQDRGEMNMDTKGTDRKGEFIGKARFYDISADSFSWQNEKSYDGGKTWHLAGQIQSTRT